MTTGTGSLSLLQAMETNSPQAIEVSDLCGVVASQSREIAHVGDCRLSLTQEQRWAAISCAGTAMEAAFATFKKTHKPADLDRAHTHMVRMLQLAGVDHQGAEA